MYIHIHDPENLRRFIFCFVGGCTVYLQFGVVFGFCLFVFNRVPRYNSKAYVVEAKTLIKRATCWLQLPVHRLEQARQKNCKASTVWQCEGLRERWRCAFEESKEYQEYPIVS